MLEEAPIVVLLEDYKINETPPSLLNVLECFARQGIAPNKCDIMCGFIFILMLEYGFVPADCTDLSATENSHTFNYQRVLRLSKQFPDTKWKKNDYYEFDFYVPTFSFISCKIVCVSIADDFIINCTLSSLTRRSNECCYSVALDPSRYIVTDRIFQCLKNLAVIVKDEIAYKAKSAIIKSQQDTARFPCLEFLPVEIVIYLARCYLNRSDISRLKIAYKPFVFLLK